MTCIQDCVQLEIGRIPAYPQNSQENNKALRDRTILTMFYRAHMKVLCKVAPAAGGTPLCRNRMKKAVFFSQAHSLQSCSQLFTFASTSQEFHPRLHPFNNKPTTMSSPNTNPSVAANLDGRSVNQSTNADASSLSKSTRLFLNNFESKFVATISACA